MKNEKDYHLADDAFEVYDFGDGVTVEEADGWESCTNAATLERIVYLSFEENGPDVATVSARFVVTFKNGMVYSVDCSCGGTPVGKPQGPRWQRIPKETCPHCLQRLKTRCDTCGRSAVWQHPEGGKRCQMCRRPK